MKAGRPKGTTGIKWGQGRNHKEPKRPQQTMLSEPALHPDLLPDLVHAFGSKERLCKELRVSPALLELYLDGTTEPPFTFLLAVYWQCPIGFGQAFSESHWTHQYNSYKRREAEERLDRVLGVLDVLVGRLGETHEVSAVIATEVAAALSNPNIGGMGGVPPMLSASVEPEERLPA